MSAPVVVLIVIAALVVAVAVFVLAGGAERRGRAADLAAEFWDWLKFGR